ncbi:MAG TPA: hypothetical protein VGM49_06120 [Candidatus Limnocylindrales bacterium]
MTNPMRRDPDLARWFADGPTTSRGEVIDAAFARARATRQRSAWQAGAWWTTGVPAVGLRSMDPGLARRVAVVAAVGALLVLGLLSIAMIGQGPTPRPFPLVFSRADRVYAAEADGSQVHLLYAPPAGFGTGDVRWSPDHSRIAIQIRDDAGSRLVIVDRSGQVLGDASTGKGLGFAWSPDSARLAVVRADSSDGFALLDSAARPIGSIALPAGLEVGYPSWVGAFSWSPDGRDLAFPGCWAPCNQKVSGGIFRVSIDGSGYRQVTNGSVDTWLAWSADGRLAASRVCDAGAPSCPPAIVVAGTDGGVIAAEGYEGFIGGWLAWSPDGARLAVVGGPTADVLGGKPATQLWVGRTDGPPIEVVSSGFRSLGQLDWSADGRSVLFAGIAAKAPDNATWSIWSLDVGTGSLAELVKDVDGFDADARP